MAENSNPSISEAVLSALAEAMQKKLNIYNEFLKTLPPSVQKRVKALKHIHEGYSKLENQLKEEIRALEKKYQAHYDVIFAQRSDIVKGTREPTTEESAGEGATEAALEDKPAKGIPGFWLRVLKNTAFADTITPTDEEALQSLEDITVHDLDKEEGFAIDFTFTENAFFTNTKLTKTYHLIDDGYDGLTLDRVEGAKIDWKPGKDLSFRLVKKKQTKGGKKGARQTRVVTVKEPAETFFNFFSPPDLDNEEIDEEEENDLEMALERDFDLGCLLKDRIIPHAVLWFTGEENMDEDFEGDEDDEDEDEGEVDDEEDEDEDEDDAPPAKPPVRGGRGGGRGGRGGRGGAPGGAPQQECKQQ